MSERRNSRLEALIGGGWRPSIHGEFLDCYNKKSRGCISGSILTGISSRNMHYVVIKHGT